MARSRTFRGPLVSALLWLTAWGAAGAQPAIDRVHNAAGRRPVFSPGGALARGALIVIEGEGLGPQVAVAAEGGRPVESLAGVSVELSSEDSSAPLLLLHAGARRIDAVIPADAKTGVRSIVVSYEGVRSPPVKAPIVASALSLFTIEDAAARPGSEIEIWGTGLGEARTKDLEVFVGGIPARVIAAAPAAAPGGRDRIEIGLPADSPAGCHTPVQARLYGSLPSNVVTIALAENCESASEAPKVLEAGGLVGLVLLLRAQIYAEMPALGGDAALFQADAGFGAFAPAGQGVRHMGPFSALPPTGSCVAQPKFLGEWDLAELSLQAWSSALGEAQTAGVGVIEVMGASGRRRIARDETFDRYADLLGGTHPYHAGEPLPDFLEPGSYAVKGGGEEGIGKFAATVQMPAPVAWKNAEKLDTVNRSEDLVLEWESGPREVPVVVAGIGLDRRTRSGLLFICREQASKERFAVPSAILQMIAPAGPTGRGHIGMLLLGAGLADDPAVFQAEGLSLGTVATLNVFGRSVLFR